MAGGVRSIKIKFIGDSKGVDRAAKNAVDAVQRVGKSVAGSAVGLGEKIAGAIGGAIEALPPQGKLLGGILVAGLAAVAAPAIGAAVSAGVLLGLGGGVLALGIKSAADSPAVKKSFAGLKKTASSVFEDFGKPFEKPLAGLGKSLKGTLKSLSPEISNLGKIMAPVVDKIGPALDGFAKKAMPGITKAVEASVPLFNTLFEKLPGIGESIGIFFEKIAANSDDVTLFFSDLLDAIGWIIEAIGAVIGWLASFYSTVREKLVLSKVAWIEFRIAVIEQFSKILDGARASLSWIPGLDSKLAAAEEKFAQFRRDANNELAMIKSQYEISIRARLTTLGFKTDSPGQFTGRAAGGPVRAGSTYLVGEHGPEVIKMGANGWVQNNRQLQEQEGEGGVAEFHIHLADDVTKVVRVNNRDLKRRTRARKPVIA